jgi:hypothetical protein
MRLAILGLLILAFGVLVLLGFLYLVRELLIKDFFHPPSMPADTEQRIPRRTSSHSAKPTA